MLSACVTQSVGTTEGYQVTYKIFFCKVCISVSLKASVIWSLHSGSERNSVQLLHCWILNKRVCVCVCVYNLSIDPRGIVKSSENPEQKIAVLASPFISLEEATNVLGRREDPWHWLPCTLISWVGNEGFEGVGTACGKDQADVWVEVVSKDYWWRRSTGGIETAESKYSHSQWKQDWNLSSVLSWGGLCGCLTKLQITDAVRRSSQAGDDLCAPLFVGLILPVSGSQVPSGAAAAGQWQQCSPWLRLAASAVFLAAGVRTCHSSGHWEGNS